MATFITLFYENFGRLIKHKTEHENQEFLFHCAFYIVLCNIFCTDRRRLYATLSARQENISQS